MGLILDQIEDQIECLEAFDLGSLEKNIAEKIELNKALMLRVHAVQHQATFHPVQNKMLYTALLHFKGKPAAK